MASVRASVSGRRLFALPMPRPAGARASDGGRPAACPNAAHNASGDVGPRSRPQSPNVTSDASSRMRRSRTLAGRTRAPVGSRGRRIVVTCQPPPRRIGTLILRRGARPGPSCAGMRSVPSPDPTSGVIERSAALPGNGPSDNAGPTSTSQRPGPLQGLVTSGEGASASADRGSAGQRLRHGQVSHPARPRGSSTHTSLGPIGLAAVEGPGWVAARPFRRRRGSKRRPEPGPHSGWPGRLPGPQPSVRPA